MTGYYSHLFLGFHGHSVPDELKKFIGKGLFGVALFSRNYRDGGQFRSLVRDLNSLGREAGNPLIIGIDQEGGRVQRLKEGFTIIPPMREIGLSGDVSAAHETGKAIGRELKGAGITLDFAPVLDVDSNPVNPIIGDRSFSPDPEICAEMGAALIRGLHSEGVFSCGKHFPGHGDSSKDSHKTLPVIEADRRTMERRELVPFKRCISEGLRFIMTSHCLYPSLDAEFPATLSEKIMNGMLRKFAGFDGLVVTDDLLMSALRDNFSVDETVLRAITASVDLLLVCEMEKGAPEYAEAMERLCRDDGRFRNALEISDQRIREFRDSLSRLYRRMDSPPTF